MSEPEKQGVITSEELLDCGIDKDFESALFSELAKISGWSEYFRKTMALDMHRYFSAPIDQQQLIKGAYSRTKYIYDNFVKNTPKS